MIRDFNKNNIVIVLRIFCLCCLVILVCGTISKIVFQVHAESTIEKYYIISQNPFHYCIGFVFFSLLSLTIVPIFIILAIFADTRKKNYFFDILGTLFLIPYTMLATIAYGSQYLIFPYLLKSMNECSMTIINSWFFTSYASIPYTIDLIGYTYLGFSSFCIGYKFLYEQGISKFIGLLLYTTGILSIIALIIHGFQYRSLGEFFSIISGGLTLPLILFILFLSKKIIVSQNIVKG